MTVSVTMLIRSWTRLAAYNTRLRGACSHDIHRRHFWRNPDSDSDRVVLPGNVSPQLQPQDIPPHVPLPPHARDPSALAPSPQEPEVKGQDEIRRMRAACRLAREVLDSVGATASVPGTTTQRLDDLVAGMCFSRGAYPSPLNYRGFPKSVCTSVNNVACHGIPDDRPLKVLFIQSCVKGRFSRSYFEQEGDIINVDVTVYLDGVHGDCSETYAVGTVDGNATRLMSATKDCLDQAITLCGPGMEFRAIGELIEKLAAEKHGFRLGERCFKSKVFENFLFCSVIGAFTGHGIGSYFHGPPDIFHARNNYPGVMLPGMTFTIEPILCEGSPKFAVLLF